MAYSDAPQLKEFYAHNNYMTSLKPLNKTVLK